MKYHEENGITIHLGDCREVLTTFPAESVQCCVTSPPYFGLRDYGVEGQIGLEETPEQYVAAMVEVFREVRRVLKDDGVAWLNLGDSYNAYNGNRGASKSLSQPHDEIMPDLPGGYGLTVKNLKSKDLIGIPWMVAFALRADGWYLRQDIIWHKPNPMPESVTDRCTKAHEYIFLLAKSDRYFYDLEAVAEPLALSTINDSRLGTSGTGRERYSIDGMGSCPSGFTGGKITGRNKRTVWTVTPQPYAGAHFATFPPDLIKPCILAGSRPGDIILDPFNGSGTTGEVARDLGRRYVGIELNADYIELTKRRLAQGVLFGATA